MPPLATVVMCGVGASGVVVRRQSSSCTVVAALRLVLQFSSLSSALAIVCSSCRFLFQRSAMRSSQPSVILVASSSASASHIPQVVVEARKERILPAVSSMRMLRVVLLFVMKPCC